MLAIIVVFAIALPVVLFCAWVHELTPQGILRAYDLGPEVGPVRAARRLDFRAIDRLTDENGPEGGRALQEL